MTFNEESLRKGIQFGLGSKGIWTPELEDEMFEEIKSQALSQDVVSICACCSNKYYAEVYKDVTKYYCKSCHEKISKN